MKDKFDQIIEDLKNNKQPQIQTDKNQSDKNIEGARLIK